MNYLETSLPAPFSVRGGFTTFFGSRLRGGEKIGAVWKSPTLRVFWKCPEEVLPVTWLTVGAIKEIGAEPEEIECTSPRQLKEESAFFVCEPGRILSCWVRLETEAVDADRFIFSFCETVDRLEVAPAKEEVDKEDSSESVGSWLEFVCLRGNGLFFFQWLSEEDYLYAVLVS